MRDLVILNDKVRESHILLGTAAIASILAVILFCSHVHRHLFTLNRHLQRSCAHTTCKAAKLGLTRVKVEILTEVADRFDDLWIFLNARVGRLCVHEPLKREINKIDQLVQVSRQRCKVILVKVQFL